LALIEAWETMRLMRDVKASLLWIMTPKSFGSLIQGNAVVPRRMLAPQSVLGIDVTAHFLNEICNCRKVDQAHKSSSLFYVTKYLQYRSIIV